MTPKPDSGDLAPVVRTGSKAEEIADRIMEGWLGLRLLALTETPVGGICRGPATDEMRAMILRHLKGGGL